jgi:hypothetical protein
MRSCWEHYLACNEIRRGVPQPERCCSMSKGWCSILSIQQTSLEIRN